MRPQVRVAGVRTEVGSPLLWVRCEPSELTTGCLGMVRTPYGERSARVVVAPQLVLHPGPVAQDYVLLGSLSNEEAFLVDPAASLRERAVAIAGSEVELRVSPDGSRITLVGPAPGRLEELARELRESLRVVVVVRDETGEVPAPPLPRLLEIIEYEGQPATVTRLSVFSQTVTLRAADGKEVTLSLPEVLQSLARE